MAAQLLKAADRNGCAAGKQMTMIRRLHLALGLLTLLAFALTGQYMDRYYGHLHGMEPAPRLLFRSAHIYVLFSGLLNCAVGMIGLPPPELWRRVLSVIGSLILFTTPVLFLLAFFKEPWLQEMARPYARPAIYGSAAAVLLHLAARLSSERAVIIKGTK